MLNKRVLLIGIVFIIIISFVSSSRIIGFNEIRFDGDLIINATTLELKSNQTITISKGVNITGGLGVSELNAANCDLKSDTAGNLFCGTDATGTGEDSTQFWNKANNDTTAWNTLYDGKTDRFGVANDSDTVFDPTTMDIVNQTMLDNSSIARMNITNAGNITITGNFSGDGIFLGIDESDQFIYFYEGGSSIGESFGWDDGNDRFAFTDEIDTTGSITAGGTIYATSHIFSGGDIYTSGANDDFWLGTTIQANSVFRAYASGDLYLDNHLNTSTLEAITANITKELKTKNITVTDTNFTLGVVCTIQYNSTCGGWYFCADGLTGGIKLSCDNS